MVAAGGFSGVGYLKKKFPQGVPGLVFHETPVFGVQLPKLDQLTVPSSVPQAVPEIAQRSARDGYFKDNESIWRHKLTHLRNSAVLDTRWLVTCWTSPPFVSIRAGHSRLLGAYYSRVSHASHA
jgi:hypothetical protein